MNCSVFRFPSPAQPMQFDGERYTSGVEGAIQREHYHRYLFALRYCLDKNVLDVASGEGYGSFLLGQVAHSVIGVDIDQKAVDFANKNYMSDRVSYRQGDAVKLPIEDQSVDVVVSFETIEHFADQTDFVVEVDRVLKPDGIVIMSSPNREIYSEAQNYQNPFHVHEMNKQEFLDLLGLRFPHIRLLEQGAVFGSVILPLPFEQTDSVEGFTTRDGQIFQQLTGVPGAPYFIALAARGPVSLPLQSVLHSDLYLDVLHKSFAAKEQVLQEQAAVHMELAAQREREMAAQVELAAQRERELAAHVELAAQRERELAAHVELAAQRERELAAHVEVAAQRERVVEVAAQRMAAHAKQTRRFQAAIETLRARLVSHEEVNHKLNSEIVELVRRLALTRIVREGELPRESRGLGSLIHRRRRRLDPDYRVVASSPLFDRDWYLGKYPDVAEAQYDPVLHYLRRGAAEDRQPGPLFDGRHYALVNPDVAALNMNPLLHFLKYGVHEGRAFRHAVQGEFAERQNDREALGTEGLNPSFDAAFFGPFYTAAGHSDDPLVVWRNLSRSGAVPPATPEAAETIAATVRLSPFFDAGFYGRHLPSGMDPALHYAVIGEIEGWAPSESFDPQFYLARYPDLKAAKVSPLMHFQDHGKAEGRRGVPAVQRLRFAPLKDERQPILVICHDASRTGAPILGWNLIRDLRKKHPIVTLLMHGGVLEKDFAADSDVVVGPLIYEEWHPAEFSLIAERLVEIYRPLYAVANSIETSFMIPPLAAFGVPSVALVNEFAAYTRPLERMRLAYDWAAHIVFPARIVANSSFQTFPGLEKRRGVHVLAQGRQLLPGAKVLDNTEQEPDIGEVMRSADEKDKFIVLGAGFIHLRKGVDLFLSVAASARRLAPDVSFKFVWVGEGYKPDEDLFYSAYLREQINKSDLQDVVVFLEAVADFEPAYLAADVFLMSSRLDPQPNVGIDAVMLGLPTVCFAGASGTGEVLASDPETRSLVVPHLDTEAAAQEICRLANAPELRKAVGRAVQRVGRSAFNAEAYVTQIDTWGREAAAALSPIDLETLRSSGQIEPELALPPLSNLPRGATVEQVVLLQSKIVGMSPDQVANANFRRAVPGFHPQAYAAAHIEDCDAGGQDPTAHWLRNGRPEGRWWHPIFSPKSQPTGPREELRTALHAHFYYTDLAPELAQRMTANWTRCDLFVSTDTEAKAEALHRVFAEHSGPVTIRVTPNLGRDIGPLLTGLREEITNGPYDLWGHVHGKKSASTDTALGDAWRTFLWDNLIGGKYPMLDIAVAAFASDPKLGLVFAEDPHLVGWDGNRKNAEALAERMGFSPEFPEYFDFPLGSMFWFRPPALRRLFALGLKWDDYPKEPLPYDGSLLHALERIVPFVTASESYGLASLRAPHSTW